MIKLSVPCIFDESLLSFYRSFNESDVNLVKISNIYGALPGLHSAREKDRFPKLNRSHLLNHSSVLAKSNIKFTYTMNSVNINLEYIRKELDPFLRYLYNNGITSITVASPLLVEYIRRKMPSLNYHITLSTIANTDSIAKLKQAIDMGCDAIVLSLRANRDIKFLLSTKGIISSFPVKICLIVNEFCGDCPIRPFHYLWESSSHKTCMDMYDSFFKQYPYNICTKLWMENYSNVLKTYWILPQWLDLYNAKFGISHFKISGRTHFDSQWHRYVIKQYGRKKYKGNIMRLAPYESCDKLNIDSDFLEQIGYLKHFFTNMPKCTSICGIDCSYCDVNSEKILTRTI